MLEGIALGLLLGISMLYSFQNLPLQVQVEARKHPVVLDLVASGFAYLAISSVSKTLVAVWGVVTATLLVNGWQRLNSPLKD